MANLTRREADIAIRPTPKPPDLLIGRRIAEIAHAIYAADACLSSGESDPAKDWQRCEWIGLDDALADTVVARWMAATLPASRIACRVDALPALRDAALAGLGLALLPCYIGDLSPGLRRVMPQTQAAPRSTLWLLTHEDLKNTARVRATLDFLAQALNVERALFEGRMPMAD
jgi:DNA-binding transcriptional LysR family regulator